MEDDEVHAPFLYERTRSRSWSGIEYTGDRNYTPLQSRTITNEKSPFYTPCINVLFTKPSRSLNDVMLQREAALASQSSSTRSTSSFDPIEDFIKLNLICLNLMKFVHYILIFI